MKLTQNGAKIGVACIASAIALLYPLYLASPEEAVHVVRHFGYWIILATVLLYFRILSITFRKSFTIQLGRQLRPHLSAALVIATATLFLHLHIEPGFKILTDEHNLASTAMNFFYNNRAFVQAGSHMLGDEVVASIGFVDKRPILFPFLVSIIHSFFGYNPDNPFHLNSGLTFLLLTLTYAVTVRSCGRRFGILAVLILSSLPLLAQNTNGGGYEILNLCLLLGLILSSIHYLEKPGATGLNILILHSVLLANTRYESILYVLVPVILFLLKSFRTREINLTWFSTTSPCLLILPLLSYRIFQSEPRFLQTSTDNFFNLSHIIPNSVQAFDYLFNPVGDHSNSILLSTVGVLALAFLAVHFCLRARTMLLEEKHLTAIATVFGITLALTLLALSHYWGAWTDPMAARFSLPAQLFLVLSVPLALHFSFRLSAPPTWVAPAVAFYIVAFTGPHTGRLQDEARMLPSAGYHWALAWMAENTQESHDLFIADTAVGFGVHRKAAIPFYVANEMPERVLLTKDLRIYDNIYVLENVWTQNDGTFIVPSKESGVNPRFIRRTVAGRAVAPGLLYRISRIEGLADAPPGQETKAANLPPDLAGTVSVGGTFEDLFFRSLPLVPVE